jgi:hypothetical protein
MLNQIAHMEDRGVRGLVPAQLIETRQAVRSQDNSYSVMTFLSACGISPAPCGWKYYSRPVLAHRFRLSMAACRRTLGGAGRSVETRHARAARPGKTSAAQGS